MSLICRLGAVWLAIDTVHEVYDDVDLGTIWALAIPRAVSRVVVGNDLAGNPRRIRPPRAYSSLVLVACGVTERIGC